MSDKRISLLDLPLDLVNTSQALDQIHEWMSDRRAKTVVTPYASFWYWAERDPKFKQALQQADLSLPDGIGTIAAVELMRSSLVSVPLIKELQLLTTGLMIGVKILTNTLVVPGKLEVVRGVELSEKLLQHAEQKGLKIFFLGGWKETQVKLQDYLKKAYPHLQYQFSIGAEDVRNPASADQLQLAIQDINQFSPDLLLIAFGPPFQEKWAEKHKEENRAGVIISVGATFDLLSGQLKRAPVLWRRIGLEWCWRLLTQPTRVSRILAAFPYFPLRVAWEKWKHPNLH
jgi:N-acetylglucosaminyldiphosphoundecaprenol N-acetyl-beta-D-mannosaminyltransferase